MLNSTSHVIKAHKPVKYQFNLIDEEVKPSICEYLLYPKNTHISIPIEQGDLEGLYQSIQDALYGRKVTA